MSFIDLIIICLSTVRLCNLLMYEEGPYNIFERIRQYAHIKDGVIEFTQKYNLLGNILICHYCTSMYTAIFAVSLYYFDLNIINAIFAVSQIAIFIIQYTEE